MKTWMKALWAGAVLAVMFQPWAAAEPKARLVSTNRDGVALQGHDPVGYFTDNRAVKGDPAISSVWQGAVYYFVSKEHKAVFDADPAKYAPQFGGFCGYAASINKVAPADPSIFQIIDGQLVLQYSQKAYRLFNEDAKASLEKAHANWPGLVEKNGK